jgi:hypothetical protein
LASRYKDGVFQGRNGGIDYLKFYVRDAHGNVSVDENDGRHILPVYVDYGSADLRTQRVFLATDFGFAHRDEPKGTIDKPYIFANNSILTPRFARQFVVRFSSPDTCRHIAPSAQDGTGDDAMGNLISGFAIHASEGP